MQQLVKAVRALLMDSEMRVANEEEALAATARAHSRLAEFGHNLPSRRRRASAAPGVGIEGEAAEVTAVGCTVALGGAGGAWAAAAAAATVAAAAPHLPAAGAAGGGMGEPMGDGACSTVPILPAATQSLRPLVGSPRG